MKAKKKMIPLATSVLSCLAVLPVVASGEVSSWSVHYRPPKTRLPAWVYRQQIRMLQAHWDNSVPPGSGPEGLHAFWERVASVGFNIVSRNYWRRPPKQGSEEAADIFRLDTIREDARAAKRLGLHLVAGLVPLCYHERIAAHAAGIPHAVNGEGKTAVDINQRPSDGMVPCFTRKGYWDVVLRAPMVAIARLSLEPDLDITGIDWDPELYGTKYAFGPWPNNRGKKTALCFCDDCSTRFAAETGPQIRTLLEDESTGAERYDLLKKSDLLKAHAEWSCAQLKKILVEIYREVHAINPRLMLTAYPGMRSYDEHAWLIAALYRSFAETPNTLAREAAYRKSHTDDVRRHATVYHDRLAGLPAIFGPMLGTGYWNHEEANYVRGCRMFMTGNPGYWAYVEARIKQRLLDRFGAFHKKLDHALRLVGGEMHPATDAQKALVSYDALPWIVGAVPKDKLADVNRLHARAYDFEWKRGKLFVWQDGKLQGPRSGMRVTNVPLKPQPRTRCLLFSARWRSQGGMQSYLRCFYWPPNTGKRERVNLLPHNDGDAELARISASIFVPPRVDKLQFSWHPGYRNTDVGEIELRDGSLVEATEIVRLCDPEAVGDDVVTVVELPRPHPGFAYCAVQQAPRGLVVQLANTQGCPTWGRLRFGEMPGERFRVLDALNGILFESPAGKLFWTRVEAKQGLLIRVRERSTRWVFLEPLNDASATPLKGLAAKSALGAAGPRRQLTEHWRRRGLKPLIRYLEGGPVRNLLHDMGADPTDHMARVPKLLEVSFERDTETLSLWEHSDNVVLVSGPAADGDRAVRLTFAEGQPTPTLRQTSLAGDYKEGTPVNLTFRAHLKSKSGGTVRVQMLDALGSASLSEPAQLSVAAARHYLPFEITLRGEWKANAARVTFEVTCTAGDVYADRLILMQGTAEAPVPARTRCRLVNRDPTGPYAILEPRQTGGTFHARKHQCWIGPGTDGADGVVQPLYGWLSNRFVLAFTRQKERPSAGTFWFRSDSADEKKTEPDGTFTLSDAGGTRPNPLKASLAAVDAALGDAYDRATALALRLEPERRPLTPFPDLVLEIDHEQLTELQALAVGADGQRRPLVCHRLGLTPSLSKPRRPLICFIPSADCAPASHLLFFFRPRGKYRAAEECRIRYYTVDVKGQVSKPRTCVIRRREAIAEDVPLIEQYGLSEVARAVPLHYQGDWTLHCRAPATGPDRELRQESPSPPEVRVPEAPELL